MPEKDTRSGSANGRRVAMRSAIVGLVCLMSATPLVAAETIPAVCPGFMVVTAVNESGRDYESIKTVEAIDEEGVHLRYSSEAMVFDWLNPGPGELKKTLTHRIVSKVDLDSAHLYLQHFGEQLPDLVPETTAIGISRELFRKLKTEGSAEFGIFIPFNVDRPGLDREKHPNVYDNQMVTTVVRSKASPKLTVTLNDTQIELPTMRFEGDFYGDKAEFVVLDDPDNPLMLQFRIGIDAIAPLSPDEVEQRKLLGMPTVVTPDKEVLRVVKIAAPCEAETPAQTPPDVPSGGDAIRTAVSANSAALEVAIAKDGRASVEAIFFTIDSATLRPESDVALASIAEVLRRHPDWRLSVEGHTDAQGEDRYNLELSKRRAAATKDGLVHRYGIVADRLTTTGYGESRPVADNASLEGRARNRRVELVRLSH